MNAVLTATFGWLIPGGAYLLTRRYLQFAIAFGSVCCATVFGVLLHGTNLWPASNELQGLDALATRVAQAGGIARMLAGGPYLLLRFCDYSQTFLAGQTHEYGSALLVLAGLFNLLALADALELRKAQLS